MSTLKEIDHILLDGDVCIFGGFSATDEATESACADDEAARLIGVFMEKYVESQDEYFLDHHHTLCHKCVGAIIRQSASFSDFIDIDSFKIGLDETIDALKTIKGVD